MTTRNRWWIILTLGTSLLGLVLLAAGLSQLELRSGNLFAPETLGRLNALLGQFGILRNFFIALFIVGIVAAIVFSLSRRSGPRTTLPRTRNTTLATLLRVLLVAIAILLLRRTLREGQFNLDADPVDQFSAQVPDLSPEMVAVQIPEWLPFAFGLGLILISGLVIWFMWRRRQQERQEFVPLQILTQEAQMALDELEAGGDLRNVILNCYYEMNMTLNLQRGIRRGAANTPREFELRLAELGMPAEPVRELTRLFELVRYGSKDLGEDDEHRAMACLNAIVQAIESIESPS